MAEECLVKYIDLLTYEVYKNKLETNIFSYCLTLAYLGKSQKWPGSARDLRAQVNRKENGKLMVADFRWKPPHDCKLAPHDCILPPHGCKLPPHDCKLAPLICSVDWKIGIIE